MTQSKQQKPRISYAQAGDDGRLHAPAAERNAQSILAMLRDYAPQKGHALELASGTGQHIALFAKEMPGLIWQPSEVDKVRLDSIRIWGAEANVPNLSDPVVLDATSPGWAKKHEGNDLILLVNLLHLIDSPSTQTLISEAALSLAAGGRLILYGPFLRDGQTTSDGDKRFHAAIQSENPALGYKNDADVLAWLRESGLHFVETVTMPANNLAIIAERPIRQ